MRWHGSTIGIGLRFMTVPTARAAFGRPTRAASAPYVSVRPYGHPGELVQHVRVERRDPQVERQVERAATALEVLVELAPDVVERRAQHAHAEAARELLLPVVLPIRDAAEPAVGRGDVQVADRRRDDVVADVDEPFGDGGGAEPRVEISVSRSCVLLRRRTPDDAAARAASSDEPSASAIWA